MFITDPLVRRLIQFYPDDGSPGSPAETGDAAPPPSNNDANGSGNQNSSQLPPQDEMNRLMGNARIEGKQVATKELLAALKMKDVEELTAFIKTARKKQQSELSEIEQLQASLAELQPAAAERDQLLEMNKAYETAIVGRVAAITKQLKLPKHITDLLADKSPLAQLEYLNNNLETLSAPQRIVPSIDGDNGAGGNTPPNTQQLEQELIGQYPSLRRLRRQGVT